jgi:epoxide hydrolase A/B
VHPALSPPGGPPPAHRFVHANGIRHHVVEQGRGPLVVLLHGWPETSYSWRHQLRALADAGYRVAAPDLRGYGQTDAPADVREYGMRAMVGDVLGIVDALGEDNAIVVGHDWGAAIAWHCALLHPDRFRAVAGLSVPLTARSSIPPTAAFRRRFDTSFFYVLYFQEPGVAERELDADPRRSLRLIYHAASGDAPLGPGFFGKAAGAKLLDGMTDPPVLPSWLTESDLDVYAAEFARSGFRGGLNRYRNMDRDWEDLADIAEAKVGVPALYVVGGKDLTQALVPDGTERIKARVVDLRGAVVIPGAGHWTQQEAPEQTNDALLAFFREV